MHKTITPIFLSGPSGVGKTYLEKHLIKNYNFKRFISTLTRPPRFGEEDGKDYHFISEEEYKKRESEGKFLTSIYILNAWRGFEKQSIDSILEEGKIPISVVVPPVVIQLKQYYPQSHAVFLMPESEELLKERMHLRKDPQDDIQKRLHASQEEIRFYKEEAKDHYTKELIVTRHNFDTIVQEILTITNL
jgi:guanylate kinase